MTISSYYNDVKAAGNLGRIPRYGRAQTGVQRAYRAEKRMCAEDRQEAEVKSAAKRVKVWHSMPRRSYHTKAKPIEVTAVDEFSPALDKIRQDLFDLGH